MQELKQVILVRKDLKLSKGKMAAQASHASVEAVLESNRADVSTWRSQGMKKSVLAVADKSELLKFKQSAKDAGLIVALITDAGRTHLEPGTITCLAIGPALEKKIDAITGQLKLIN